MNGPSSNAQTSGSGRDQLILNLSFPLNGTITTYLGTLLPALTARFSLTDPQAGALFAAQFAGALAGALSEGWIASRWGAHRAVAAGFLLMTIGTAALAWGSADTILAAFFCSGIGIGWSTPASNWLAARYAQGLDQVRAVNIVNASWCAGAVAGPVLISRGLTSLGMEKTLLATAALLLAMTGLTTLLGDVDAGEAKPVSTASSRRRVRHLALVTAAMLFSYVGLENGISGWTPSLAARELRLNATNASLALSGFWCAVLTARIAASFSSMSRWIGLKSLLAALTVTAAGLVLMTTAGNKAALGIGVVLAGVGCSTIFPTIVSLFQIRCGAGSETWMGFVIGAGNLGATTIPWLVGASSSRLGGLRWAMTAVLLSAIAGLMAMLPAMREQERA